MQIDTKAIKVAHDDPSGTTTTAHALDHVEDIQAAGTYQAGLQGDQPTSETGTAATTGKKVGKEKTDISKKDAKAILKKNIKR